MKILINSFCICTALVFSMVGIAYADTKPIQKDSVDDAKNMQVKAIEHILKSQFDKPDAPLKVKPVTIEGHYAVAGWFQKEKGGRAFLQFDQEKWSIVVCGGDGLRDPKVLIQTGMDSGTANALAKKVQASESQLTKFELQQLSLFEGMVKIEAGQHHGSGSEHKHH